jgi:teichuronic acid biosynthesis glycosyltransferase TuaH
MCPESLIFVSLEVWDDIWRRNQFVCAELARRNPAMSILFVEPAVDISAAVRRRCLHELTGGGTRRLDTLPNVTITRAHKWLPNSVGAARRANEAVVRRHVRAAAQRLGLYAGGRKPMLWLNPYYAEHMIGRLGEAATIYDITDDWTQFGDEGSTRRRIVEQDRRLSERADAIIVCSEALHASKAEYADKLHLIGNGVDCEHYADVRNCDSPLPALVRSWRRPVLGYTGTLHRDRLDVTLLVEIARRMREGTVVLIGPCHLNGDERRRLEATGRVVLAGPIPYAKLPEAMRGFDVCIVPHRVTPFTESLNPIKLWEYLAAGKPIVSTPVAGFRDYPQHVRLAGDADAFLCAATDALSENGTAALRRQQLAGHHSWVQRVAAVERVIAQVSDRVRGNEIGN